MARPSSLETLVLADEIVVGVSDAVPDVSIEDYDVLLTAAPAPPRPWVRGSPAELDAAVRASPAAAVALVQVLRVTEGGSVRSGLVVESLAYSMLQHGAVFREWLRAREVVPARPEEHEPVGLERFGDRLDITLQRPEVHNAMSAPMRDALCEAFDLVAGDPTVEEVHLRGAGPSFCSGGDLDEFGTARDAAAAHLIRVARSVGRRIHEQADRVTAHLHGACIGAGIELGAFAGRVTARNDVAIRLPEVQMGLIPGAGGTVSLPRRIGRHRTAYLALSGAGLDATTARSWGLVDQIT